MNAERLACSASAATSRSSDSHSKYSGRLPQSIEKNQQSPESEHSSDPIVTWEAGAHNSNRCSSAPLPVAGTALFHSSFMLSPAVLSTLYCTETTCAGCYPRYTSPCRLQNVQWRAWCNPYARSSQRACAAAFLSFRQATLAGACM